MRVLFTVAGSGPRLYLMVPLAWACRAAGHEVRLATTAPAPAELVRTGLPVVPVASGPVEYPPRAAQRLAAAMAPTRPWPADWAVHPQRLTGRQLSFVEEQGRYGVAVAAAMVDDLVAQGRAFPADVIVYDAATFAGPVAAAALGVPGVRHSYGVCSAARVELSRRDGTPLPEYLRLFERFEADPNGQPQSTVDITPPSMRLATGEPGRDLRFLPYNGPGLEPVGLDGRTGRQRVCVSQGRGGVEEFRSLIGAVASAGVDVVVAASAEQLADLGALPVGVTALAAVPLDLILAHCDAIVQPGEEGTTLTAAALGVPQLILTRTPDSVLTAGGLTRTGAGIHLHQQELDGDPEWARAVQTAVRDLLDQPGYREAAGRLRAEIERQPAPAAVAAALARPGR